MEPGEGRRTGRERVRQELTGVHREKKRVFFLGETSSEGSSEGPLRLGLRLRRA